MYQPRAEDCLLVYGDLPNPPKLDKQNEGWNSPGWVRAWAYRGDVVFFILDCNAILRSSEKLLVERNNYSPHTTRFCCVDPLNQVLLPFGNTPSLCFIPKKRMPVGSMRVRTGRWGPGKWGARAYGAAWRAASSAWARNWGELRKTEGKGRDQYWNRGTGARTGNFLQIFFQRYFFERGELWVFGMMAMQVHKNKNKSAKNGDRMKWCCKQIHAVWIQIRGFHLRHRWKKYKK